MSEQIDNAQITDFYFQIERDMLSFWLGLKYAVCNQSVGGWRLAGEDGAPHPKTASAVFNLLRTVGVDSTLDLKGKFVRVKHPPGRGGVNPIIGHILEDQWWDIEKELSSAMPALAAEGR
jgi:hypothetical protein